jgi:15-cis-phytoene desaturase
MEDAVFPSQWRPGLPIKLPGQTKVSPEEYREFLSLGHGDIYDIDIDHVFDPPWRYPGIDPSDFFNYGMNENTWKQYIAEVKRYRLEFTMKGQIQTLDHGQGAAQLGGPPMGGQAYGAWAGEGDGDQNLQPAWEEPKDEQYEAFVTNERPAVSL